jgi:hypothetical protein
VAGRGSFAVLTVAIAAAACSSGPIALGRLEGTSSAVTDAGSDAESTPNVPSTADGGVCDAPAPTRHYTFDGTGTAVVDLRGGPNATVHGGAALDGSGVLHLDGIDDWVDLPNGILGGKEEVSIAVWVRRLGGPAAYKRIFDFGTTGDGEDPPLGASTTGRTYLAATPDTGNVPSGLAVMMSAGGPPGEIVAPSDVVLEKELRLVVVVVSRETLSLFHQGILVTRVPRSVPLTSIVDDNAWLGRSQYSADGFFEGDYADLRIYDQAIADCAVRSLYAQGSSP